MHRGRGTGRRMGGGFGGKESQGNALAVGGPGYDLIKGQGGTESRAGGEGQDQIVGEASEIDDEFAVMDDWADLPG